MVTFTHVGWLGVRAYESFESYWHGDGPRPKKSHACNETPPGSGRYKALCGKLVTPGDGGDMLPSDAGDVTTVKPATIGLTVTCKACRRRIATGRREPPGP